MTEAILTVALLLGLWLSVKLSPPSPPDIRPYVIRITADMSRFNQSIREVQAQFERTSEAVALFAATLKEQSDE